LTSYDTNWGGGFVATTGRAFRPVYRVVSYPFHSHRTSDVTYDNGTTYRTVSYERPNDMD